MPRDKNSGHTYFEELVQSKIPAFKGVKSRNNRLILGYIARSGPSLPYDIFKSLKEKGFYEDWQYPTVYRRIKDLKEKGYLEEAGRRLTRRGKQTKETQYGLTWRGFLASIAMEEVRGKAITVAKKNPLLTIPGVSENIKESIISILQELVNPQELNTFLHSVLTGFLEAIPNLEIQGPLWIWFFQMKGVPLPNGFKLEKVPRDLFELLDRPEIFRIIKDRIIPEVAPYVRQKTIEVKQMYTLFFVLNNVIEYFSDLDLKNKPSAKMKDYLESLLEAGRKISIKELEGGE